MRTFRSDIMKRFGLIDDQEQASVSARRVLRVRSEWREREDESANLLFGTGHALTKLDFYQSEYAGIFAFRGDTEDTIFRHLDTTEAAT